MNFVAKKITLKMLVCISCLPMIVKKEEVIKTAEEILGGKCIQATWIWNKHVVIMNIEGVKSLFYPRIHLPQLYYQSYKIPILEKSNISMLEPDIDAPIVNIRIYLINPIKEKKWSKTKKYIKETTDWQAQGCDSSKDELIDIARKIINICGIDVKYIATTTKIFNETNKRGNIPVWQYVQLIFHLKSMDEVEKYLKIDGEMLKIRGIDSIIRVEKIKKNQMQMIQHLPVINFKNYCNGDEPPPLLEDMNPDL